MKDNPLFKLDNVVMTPHSAANTKNAMIGMAMVVDDVIRVLEGKNQCIQPIVQKI